MPQKILLVDDDENILFLFGLALEEHGFTVHTAITGEEALSLSRVIDFDVVLLDYKLSDLDGVKVAEEMYKINEKTALVIITGTRDIQLPENMEKVISKILLKPVSEEDLVTEIHSTLSQSTVSEVL